MFHFCCGDNIAFAVDGLCKLFCFVGPVERIAERCDSNQYKLIPKSAMISISKYLKVDEFRNKSWDVA